CVVLHAVRHHAVRPLTTPRVTAAEHLRRVAARGRDPVLDADDTLLHRRGRGEDLVRRARALRVVDARGQGEERLVLLLVTAVVPVRGQRHHLVPLLARLDQRQGERDVVVLLRHLLLGGLRRRPV